MKKLLITITISITGIFVITTDCLEHYAFFHVEMVERTGDACVDEHRKCPEIKCEGVTIKGDNSRCRDNDCCYCDCKYQESQKSCNTKDCKQLKSEAKRHLYKFLLRIFDLVLVGVYICVAIFPLRTAICFINNIETKKRRTKRPLIIRLLKAIRCIAKTGKKCYAKDYNEVK